MPAPIESSGDIEIFCFPADRAATRAPFFGAFGVGDRLALVFAPGDGAASPFALKIFSPTGANILDTIIRDLPTGLPQSPPPIEFVVSTKGDYRIDIRELKGRGKGEAKYRVS